MAEDKQIELAQRLTHAEAERDRARQRHRDLEDLSDRDIYVILPTETWLAICAERGGGPERASPPRAS